MAKIQVSHFKKWDPIADEYIVSKFLAPLETIKSLGAVPIDGNIEIDDSELDGNSFYLPTKAP